MRLGVLDIGSNSAQLQVVNAYADAPPLPIHTLKEPTLLGEAFEADGTIDADGVNRVVAAVSATVRAAERFGVDQLYAFVTSAVRDATNREEIMTRLQHEAGVRPQFLTGEDEARLTYHAAHRWYGWQAGRVLLLDIGGGSMEIVLGRGAEPQLAVSLPLGAGRLCRAFLSDDPPKQRQLRQLRQHVRDTIREVGDRLRWEGRPDLTVATSKTFKQLARLAGAPSQRKGPFVRRSVTLDDLRTWIPQLARRTTSERAALSGISAGRARQIVAGAITAGTTMKALDVDRVEVCPWALREGVILRYLQTMVDTSQCLPLHPVVPRDTDSGATVHVLTPTP